MRYQTLRPAALDPFDHVVGVVPGGREVVVAVPDLPDAIGNLVAAGFVIESCTVTDTVLDDTSHVA